MRKLKVGFLMPYSGIYPYYGHHLMAGMQLAIQSGTLGPGPAGSPGDLQFVPVFTQKGDDQSLKKAVEQLLFFERVDLLSGLISYKTMPDIIPLINTHRCPALFFDLGENLPGTGADSPYVFYASQQIWQSEYALGRWAEGKFKEAGMVVLPIYEAGYQLHSSFWEGIQSAGGQALRMHTISKEKSHGRTLNLTDFFAVVAREKPAFVHGIFTGDQGTDFIRQWIGSEFNHKIPLILVENMAYEDHLEDLGQLDFSFYAASSWSRTDERPENRRFVQGFELASGQKANIFALLGYEAGLIVREVQSAILRGDTGHVLHLLRTQSVMGPRGARNFDSLIVQPMPTMDIQLISMNQRNIRRIVIDQQGSSLFPPERMKAIHQETVSGWYNPYFCI